MDPTLDVPFIQKKQKQKSTQLKTDQKMDSHGTCTLFQQNYLLGFPSKLHKVFEVQNKKEE